MSMRKLASATALTLVFSVVLGIPATATQIFMEEEQTSPIVTDVSFYGTVRTNDLVEFNGSLLDQVQSVVIDSTSADFFVVDQNQLSVRIPRGVQPGDVLVKLAGEFGERSYQNLFEVVASDEASLARVTVGTFQGFAAVYTKNLKGHDLTIKINERERVIPQLAADFTRNLTLVGAGRLVTVQVFLNSELVKVQRLRIQ